MTIDLGLMRYATKSVEGCKNGDFEETYSLPTTEEIHNQIGAAKRNSHRFYIENVKMYSGVKND